MKKALYAGSFDPITNGHLDIIERASKLCDNLIIGVIYNPQKTTTFSVEERCKLIGEVTKGLSNVSVDSFHGLLADYVNDGEFSVVVRGLRGNSDFNSEIEMAQMNARLYRDDVETIFLMTDPNNSFVSSSMAKEVHSLGGNVRGVVPDLVLEYMDEQRNK